MDASNDFAALARRYWGMWGDAMRDPASPSRAGAGMQGMRDALDAWTRQVTGQAAQAGFGNLMEHFNRQSGDWFAQMQQVAAQFVGRDHQAADVANAWRNAFGSGGNPFQELLQGMRGPGLEGVAQWNAAAAPYLQGMRSEAAAALSRPAFGFTREHQERLQALGQAQLRWQRANEAYNALMAKVAQDAFSQFESKLAEREEPGRQIGSVRALFDLWVDAAEDAWAKAALSPDYRHVFGELVNAQMQLRAAAQAIGEQTTNQMGLPGRTELDGAHRKIAELERQLRRMQRSEAAPAAAKPAAKAVAKPASRPASKPVSKPVAKTAAKPAARKADAKPAARKAAAKPAKNVAARKPATPVKAAKPAARKR